MIAQPAERSTSVPPYVIVGCLSIDSVISANGDLIVAVCGGNSLYAAVGTHIWDHRVGMVARAGSDYPAECLAEIGEAVDLRGLRRLDRPHPVRVTFAYRPDGSRTRRIPEQLLATLPSEIRPSFAYAMKDDELAFAMPTPGDIPRAWLAGVDALHLPMLNALSYRGLIAALRSGRPARLITVDWPSQRDEAVSDDYIEVLREIDVVLPSEEDLASFRPGLPVLEAARELIACGARAAVVKLGANGCIVVDAHAQLTHVPAYPSRTVDPTGAGDSFCGGFLVGLRETRDLVRAALYGTVAASFVVEERTAVPVFAVSRASAEERLAMIADGVRPGITTESWRQDS